MFSNSQNASSSPAALLVDLYRLSVDEALRELDAPRDGLTGPEAAARLTRFGPNALKARTKTPLTVLFLRQLANPLAYILMAAALVKLLVKGVLDARPASGPS
jgi:magnesium-transporting ATPase (P-type)